MLDDLAPYWANPDGTIRLYHGKCLTILPGIGDATIDAVITDPPYALPGGFMGKDWDRFPDGLAYQERVTEWAAECLRVLKPGGWLIAFGGSRTAHRLTCGIEDAGFEIHPMIGWVFAQGFPKSHDVSKAIDKLHSAERKVIGEGARFGRGSMRNRSRVEMGYRPTEVNPDGGVATVTEPATPEARQWDGWGTGLKPALEPITVARKPLARTVAANVLKYGTGALHIDACRVRFAGPADQAETEGKNRHADFGSGPRENNILGDMSQHSRAEEGNYDGSAGRWPPNVVFTHAEGCRAAGTRTVAGNGSRNKGRGLGYHGGNGERGTWGDPGTPEVMQAWDCVPGCPVAELDAQSGNRPGFTSYRARTSSDGTKDVYGAAIKIIEAGATRDGYDDQGGASRFFPVFRYCPKAGADERPHLEDGTAHSTVKPQDLMNWLVRLVVPQGAVVLDPFAGTGTTGRACVLEGMSAILVEQDEAHCQLAVQKLSKPVQQALF